MAKKFAHGKDRLGAWKVLSQILCMCSGPSFIAKYNWWRPEKFLTAFSLKGEGV